MADINRSCLVAASVGLQQIAMPTALHQSPTLEGLPKQFVAALRTLFDILDEKGIGFVKFTDIENRWEDDGTKGLPKGVIESLRKVTPPNGLLSFERFCAGLKICLLRNQMENKKRGGGNRSRDVPEKSEASSRPPSAPLLDADAKQGWSMRHSNMPQQRTISMPQLPAEPALGIPVKSPLYGPPKPPRSGVGVERNVEKCEIRSALQSWQLGVMLEEEKRGGSGAVSVGSGYRGEGGAGTGGGNYRGERPRSVGDGKPAQDPHKKPPVRRREPRRHTLQNGIDYNMLKKMKQIEVEKDVLMQGLEAVDRARDWYMKQIASVQEKMNNLGRTGLSEQWSEGQEERVELLRARIVEVSRQLSSLSEPGLPLHMNLAVTPHSSPHHLATLRRQNHLLTQEVTKKSERISTLEREKASLIRELFASRTQSRPVGQQEPAPFM